MDLLLLFGSFLIFVNKFLGNAECAKILFVNSAKAVSHQKPFNLICRELAKRGHEVHVITPIRYTDETLKDLTVYDISDNVDKMERDFVPSLSPEQKRILFQKPDLLTTIFFRDPVNNLVWTTWYRLFLEHNNVKLLLSKNKHFDLVIVEWIFPTMAAFGAHYQCPMIGIASMGFQSVGMDSAGNPSHPLIYPDTNLPMKRDLSFFDKISVTIYSIAVRINFYWKFIPENDKLVQKHFGSHVPYLGDILKNASLFLMNRHPILHGPIPLFPNVIEYGGIKYPKENKSIDADVKKFLDASTEGVVFFSLGSSFHTILLIPEVLKAFQDAFRAIPYKVLWKWHNSTMENQPKNVMVRPWLPQTAILDHPNVKLFIFQGGLQSTEEAIAAHKPIIGFPLHSDQVGNIDTCVKFGMGKVLDLETVTAKKISKEILEIMEDYIRYAEKAKEFDRLINDQQTDGLEKALWWIEYVIRNNGAKHLRSKSVDMPLWEYYMFDVFGIVIGVLVLTTFICCYVSKRVLRLFGRFRSKTKVE